MFKVKEQVRSKLQNQIKVKPGTFAFTVAALPTPDTNKGVGILKISASIDTNINEPIRSDSIERNN